ncbi:MAG: class I SAM-dependent RNA methyltransferase [Deltaproteobacteria bacterium]|nr:class I SAM-dependent RNA methyltransferase [Deltaproteobacteria bacterium]
MGRPRKLTGATLEVRVERLDDEAMGHAVTRDARRLEVSGVLPGELVDVEVTHVTGTGRAFGRAVRVRAPSRDRVRVPCDRSSACLEREGGACGGCGLIHVDRAFELEWKRTRVSAALGLPVEPVLTDGNIFGYRALAKQVVSGRRLGAYVPWTHDVAETKGCLVHLPVVERALEIVREALPDTSDLRFVIVRGSRSEGRAAVTLVASSIDSEAARAVARALEAHDEIARVELHENARDDDVIVSAGPARWLVDRGPIHERVGAIELEVSGTAFTQVNPGAAALLYERVCVALSDLEASDPIVDLYSGSGGIGLSLAAAGHRVTFVERNREAAEAIRAAAHRQGLEIQVIAARAEDAIGGIGDPRAIVLNPPRKGASPEVLDAVAQRGPMRLVYVSCNPRTLARDLSRLSASVALHVRSVTPVDLFPKTRHVETLLVADLSQRTGS